MMREIKFRAWLGSRMSCVFSLSDTTEKSELFFVGECKIMQYTGLSDKNGKEIYEGDIVLMPTGTVEDIKEVEIDGAIYNAYKSKPPEPRLISNLGYAFFLGTKEKPDYCGVLNYGSHRMYWDLEVIGNIYEHGHLLNDTDS